LVPFSILALMTASLLAAVSPASAATLNNAFVQMYFNHTTAGVNYVNLDAGNGATDGSKVLWRNVATAKNAATGQDVGVDALVTTNLSAGTTILSYGSGTTGVAGDFQTNVVPTIAGGYAAFTFAFYKAGTYGTSGQEQENLRNVQVTGKDIDNTQFNAFDGVSGYSLSSPTRMTVSKTPTNGWPANISVNSPNINGADDPRDQGYVSYASVTSTQIRMGKNTSPSESAFALTWKAESFYPLGSADQGETSTVNYDLNSGVGILPSPVTGPFGTAAGTVPYASGFSRAGFIFTGWNTGAAGSGVSYSAGSALVLPSGTTTLFAQWVADTNPYPITYFSNGATTGAVPAAGSYAGGSPYTVSGNSGSLGRPGFTFGGWNSRADGTGTSYPAASSYSTPATLNLFAVWTPASYSIYYDGNGSTSTLPATGTLTPPTPYTIATNNLTRTGFTRGGWNTAADGTGTNYASGASYSTSANLYLYAKWTGNSYTVTYNGNANTGGSVPASGTYTSGTPYTVSANTGGLVRSGVGFTGWNTAANGTGTSYPAGSSYTAVTGANLTLYAQYARWTIRYSGNGSQSGSVPAAGTYTTGGAAYSVANNTGSLALPGYTFAGWNTSPDGGGTAYAAGASYNTDANSTLYAQWTPNTYSLTYDGNGSTGGSVPAAGSYTSGNAPYVVVDNTGTLTRPGYVFTGWNTLANGLGIPLVPGATYVPTASQTLFAQWVATTYVISYDGNGATAGVAPPNGGYTSGGTVYTVLGNTGTPALTRPGYTFAGWNSAANGSGTAYGPGTANLTYSSPADLALYAQWTQNPSYSITYDQGSAPGVTGNVPAAGSYTDGGAAYTVVGNTGSPAVLSRPGYTFANWTTDPSGVGGTAYGPGTANTTYSTAAALTLYPAWSPWATMSVHVNSTGYNESYDGVTVAVSKDGGPFTYKSGTTDANGDWNAGSIDPNATYQVRLTQPCDSHASETKNAVAWGTGAYSPVLTLAATVPCAPVLSYNSGTDTMSWSEPNDGGLHVSYYTYHYNTPARLSAIPAKPWAMFARYWPSGVRSVPFGTYASSGCPAKGTGVWPAANAGPAPYTEAPQCLRGLGAPARSTTYLWKVAARNGLPTPGVNTPAGGNGWGRMSDSLPITRPAA
jgi:uncharacterized repeat protein (TIGR02543 family)